MKLATKLQSTAKATVFFGLVAATSIASQMAFANTLFFKGASKGAPIFTLTIITPGNKQIDIPKWDLYFGSSTTNPCSDLQHFGTGPDFISSTTAPWSSDDIIKAENDMSLKPGTWTCMRQDVVYNNKTYSTGNIQFVWNGTQYVAANPSAVTLDLTK